MRVVAHDAYQGAANAEYTKTLGIKKVYILNDKEAYGLGVATNYRNAAESLGIEIAGFDAFDPKASSYEALYKKIQGTGADGIFIGALIDENGSQLIKDKVAVLGPNNGAVKLLTPDGFFTQATIDDTGPASADMYASVAGQPIEAFQGVARQFALDFSKEYLGEDPDPYSIYAAQAAQSLLDAIGASDASRSDVISKLFATTVTNGLLGSFSFNENGDPAGASGACRRDQHREGGQDLRVGRGRLACTGDGRRSQRRVGLLDRWGRAPPDPTASRLMGGHCPPVAFLIESTGCRAP